MGKATLPTMHLLASIYLHMPGIYIGGKSVPLFPKGALRRREDLLLALTVTWGLIS